MSETLSRIIEKELLACQNELIEELMQNESLALYECLENEYEFNPMLKEYDFDNPKEIFQWWLVSDWLAEKLREQGEPMLAWAGCEWWGRTGCGYPLEDESCLTRIAKKLES